MTGAYFELIGGASGNMLLGALVDAGADLDAIEAALRTLPVSGWSTERRRVVKLGIAATYFDFIIPGEDHHAGDHAHAAGITGSSEFVFPRHGRHLSDVLAILECSDLSASAKARARQIYVRLGEAEAKVHDSTVEHIHFHEVGATDAILDVAGTCIALDLLGIEAVYCSAFPLGRGSISMEHGRYPNPPPATAELMRGAPTYDAGIEGEMVTTTGAAILSTLVAQPGVRPAMRTERIGYGAGRSDFALPNVLRASIGAIRVNGASDTRGRGDTSDTSGTTDMSDTNGGGPHGLGSDEVVVLEANVDDMSPQRFELAVERALEAGAYDVWLAPVTMKKSRPAILFGAVAPLECEAAVARAMLAETTTLGVRVRRERRYTLPRETATHETPLGTVRVKTAIFDGQARRTLEYDDVARIARERHLPFAEVARRLEESLPPL